MVTLVTGVQVDVDPPPLPAVTTTTLNDLISTVSTPATGISLAAPSILPSFTDVPEGDVLVLPATGLDGEDGTDGVDGAPGPPGDVNDPDLQDLKILFENGLI